MRWLFGFLIAVVIGILSYSLILGTYLNQKVSISEARIFEVHKGLPLRRVAEELKSQGFIQGSARLFSQVGQLKGYGSRLKWGEYLIEPQDTYASVLDKIVSGKNHRYSVTFVEGDHMYKFAQQIEALKLGEAQAFLKLAKDPAFVRELIGESQESLEGYLFPDTYLFTKYDGVRLILSTMVGKFREQTERLNFKGQKYTRHQIVTLASIIEKETGAPQERPLISSVFHNRLNKRMRLQTDPTIIYGILDETGQEVKNIRRADIRRPTRYNTYTISGLPPGPIASPGLASLQAAISPEPSDYLFFVSRNDGTHVFTKTYDEHQREVRKFQLDPKMREGRSWRDGSKAKANP